MYFKLSPYVQILFILFGATAAGFGNDLTRKAVCSDTIRGQRRFQGEYLLSCLFSK